MITRAAFGAIVAGALLALLASVATPAHALPRYTARYEQKCALCHVNPSGGGLRNAYASQRLVPDEIAWRRAKPALLAKMDSTLANFLLIGADFREMYIGSDVRYGHLNFFQMQSDLYVNLLLDDRVSIYFDKGRSDTYEVFGLGYVTPHAYLKAGRFVPSYGWKFDDHTMFVREILELAPPANSDVGLEAGYSHGPLDVQVDVVNGARGSIQDTDTKAAATLNVLARRHLGPFGVGLGASGYHRPSDLDHFDTYGGYGYLTWKAFTWVGETDYVRRKPIGGESTVSLVASHEVTWLARQGLEVKATYDFYDPDIDVGAGSKWRLGGGVTFMPYPYLAVDAAVRRTKYEDGVLYSGLDEVQTLLQLHLFR